MTTAVEGMVSTPPAGAASAAGTSSPTVANIPGRSVRPGLGTRTIALTVRACGSTTSPIRSTRPEKLRSGNAASRTVA